MGFGPKSEEAKTPSKKIGKNHFMFVTLNISFILRMTDYVIILLLVFV